MARLTPPGAPAPLLRLTSPLRRFLQLEASSGLLLIAAAAIALAWANLPGGEGYLAFWERPLAVGPWQVPVAFLVNDGLMTVFFYQVGLEVRREARGGVLSDWRRAAVPAAAALGGMLVPAGCYLALAPDAAARAGWGIPMATDIAFALGILALLGRRVPPSLRVLLLALAVLDDLGAVLVIALFYGGGLQLLALPAVVGGLGAVLVLQRLGVRHPLPYLLAAALAWGGTLALGIHPTIAGVALGLLTPAGAAQRLEARLHPWVAFGVMPLFALANAGVAVQGVALEGLSLEVLRAAAVGLVLGKPVGVVAGVLAVVALKLGSLPPDLGPRHLLVLGAVAGVGFTMSLFVAALAFPGEEALLAAARAGVLLGSAAAAALALGTGRLLLPAPGPQTGDRPIASS